MEIADWKARTSRECKRAPLAKVYGVRREPEDPTDHQYLRDQEGEDTKPTEKQASEK